MNKQYPYDVAGNYTFDAGKIEVVGGVAKLKLQTQTWQGAPDTPQAISSIGIYNSKLYAYLGANKSVWVLNGNVWEDTGYNQGQDLLAMLEHNGKLYASTRNAIFAFDGTTWTSIVAISQYSSYSELVELNGDLYVAVDGGLYLIVNDAISSYWHESAGAIGAVAVHQGELYIGLVTGSGAGSIRVLRNNALVGFAGFGTGAPIIAMESFDGVLYVATRNYVVRALINGSWTFINSGVSTDLVASLKVFANNLYYSPGPDVQKLSGSSFVSAGLAGTVDLLAASNQTLFTALKSPGRVNHISAAYPTDNPSIEPLTLYTPGDVKSWDIFSETKGLQNLGTIGYNLYKGDKTNKYYWNGTAWVTGGSASNYNSIATIQANIATFDSTPDSIGYVAYLFSDGIQIVELDSNTIAYTSNLAPLINSGIDKTIYDKQQIYPFSDAIFSDPDGTITKAEYQITGIVDTWTEISQGNYGTLLEAVQNFNYQGFNTGTISSTNNVKLRVTDNSGAPNATQIDELIVTIKAYIVTFNVIDEVGAPISNVEYKLSTDISYILKQVTPFNLYTNNIGIEEIVIKKDGWSIKSLQFDTNTNSQQTVVLKLGGEDLKLIDIIPDIAEVPKQNPTMAEAISFLYRYFRLRRGRKWWNMKRFIIRG